jgi:integrase/recombinase XerD
VNSCLALTTRCFLRRKWAHDAERGFAVLGLSRNHWRNASPIRRIVRSAFEAAGLEYPNPHKVRKTLARLGEQKARTLEEWKAWSQNLGHESEMTTFRGYGEVPFHRQSEIMKAIGCTTETTGLQEQIAMLEQITSALRETAR